MASPTSAISAIVLGPTDLGFTVSMPGPLSDLTKNTIALYAEAIGRAVNAEDDDSRLDELKENLITLVENEGGTWTASASFRSARPSPSTEGTLLAKAMRIISNANHVVPLDSRDWTMQLLRIAREMTAEDVAELKGRCSASVWAALVFSNIRPTPARVLNDQKVGRVKVAEWDLFPVPFEVPCVNCTRKKHECHLQFHGCTKCRECALFQLSCPKNGPRGRPRRSVSGTMVDTDVEIVPTQIIRRKRKRSEDTASSGTSELTAIRAIAMSNAELLKRTRLELLGAISVLHDYATSLNSD